MIDNNEEMISDDVYSMIGIGRIVLVRKYPEVTREINMLIREGKTKSNPLL